MSNTLYELSTAFQDLLNTLTDPEIQFDDEARENLVNALNGIKMDIHAKAENMTKIIRDLEGQADMVDVEIKRLQARKQALSNKADFLRDIIKGTMEHTGIDKINSSLFSIALSKPKAGAVIINIPVEELPQEYQKVTIIADKTALKNDLKDGVVIDGVEIEMNRTLSIR
jgi:siphovirus